MFTGNVSASVNNLMFRDPSKPLGQLSLEAEFFVELAKATFQPPTAEPKPVLTSFLLTPQLRRRCIALAGLPNEWDTKAKSSIIRDGCFKIWTMMGNVSSTELLPDAEIDKKLTLYNLMRPDIPVNYDGSRLAALAAAVADASMIASTFKITQNSGGESEGYILTRENANKLIRIWRDGGNGGASAFLSEIEAQTVAAQADQLSLTNCIQCLNPLPQVKTTPQKSILDICCKLISDVRPAIAPPPPTDLTFTPRLMGNVVGDGSDVLHSLSDAFKNWYQTGNSVSFGVDDVTKVLLETLINTGTPSNSIVDGLFHLYNLTESEIYALQVWVKGNAQARILPGLKEALSKMPPVRGVAIQGMVLDKSTFDKLEKAAAGLGKNSTAVTFEVRDLVVNLSPFMDLVKPEYEERSILSASINLDNDALMWNPRQFFVINSKSASLISPFYNTQLRDINFMQGLAGKFTLIGRQVWNSAPKDGDKISGETPYVVYYLDESEPKLATRPTFKADSVKKALAAEGSPGSHT